MAVALLLPEPLGADRVQIDPSCVAHGAPENDQAEERARGCREYHGILHGLQRRNPRARAAHLTSRWF